MSQNGIPLRVRLWGTRGTVTPSMPSTVFGVHTTALEFLVPGKPSIFIDLGTGAIPASQRSVLNGRRDFSVFMSHYHLDHMFGATGFAPFYDPSCTVRIYGAGKSLSEAFRTVFGGPIFPVSFDSLPAEIVLERIPFRGRRLFPAHGLTLSWGAVPHPQGCTAYRLDDGVNAVVFATDVELELAEGNRDLAGLLSEPYPAGLAIVDGFFKDRSEDYHEGWGHSTWRQAWDWCERHGVESLAVTHHNPRYSDSELLSLESSAGLPNVVWARDSQTWSLYSNHAVCD